jgi:hypothetical protein
MQCENVKLTRHALGIGANRSPVSGVGDARQCARKRIIRIELRINRGPVRIIYERFQRGQINAQECVKLPGNGITYTPNVTPAYDLGEDDYLDKDEPIRILRSQPLICGRRTAYG